MMLKKTECKNKLNALNRKVYNIKEDIKMLIIKHDTYTFESEQAALHWFSSLPIETLAESLADEGGKPRQKLSLQDFNLKSNIKRGYNDSIEKLEKAFIDVSVANIDCILNEIDEVLERSNSDKEI